MLGLFMLLLMVGLQSTTASNLPPPQPDFPVMTATHSTPATVIGMQESLTQAKSAVQTALSTQGAERLERRSPGNVLVSYKDFATMTLTRPQATNIGQSLRPRPGWQGKQLQS